MTLIKQVQKHQKKGHNTWSEQNGCTAWILYRVFKSRDYEDSSRKKNHFDHVSLSDEETRDIKKELDDIDNKFDDARAAKLKCSQ